MCKRILSTFLLSSLLLSNVYATDKVLSAAPSDISTANTSHTMPVIMEVESLNFSVSVPTQLPVYIDVKGNVMVAENATIVNNSNKDIQVTDITYTPKGDWSLKPYDNTMGDKEYGVIINGNKSGDGTLAWNDFRIIESMEVPISYGFKVKEGLEGVEPVEVADVTMVLDWFVRDPNKVYSGDELYDGSTMVAMNETFQLQAPQTFSMRSTSTWSSSDEEIATIDEAGYVTPIKPGRVTMTYGPHEVPVHIYGTQVAMNSSTVNTSMTDVVAPSHYEKNGTWYTFTSIGYEGFKGNNSINSIVIPDTVSTISYGSFYQCSKLTSVILPKSIKSIGASAFRECSLLSDVVIPDNVVSIGAQAFYRCGITEITVPSDVKLDSSVFCECINLTTAKVLSGITDIPWNTFSGCTNLTTVYLPSTIKSIAKGSFNGTKLGTVNYEGSSAEWGVISISPDGNQSLSSCTINYDVSY